MSSTKKVHNASSNKKFNFKAQDSVVGANSSELRRKIMNQIPNDPAKTKQLRSNLKLSEGERIETAINVRTEDGITNRVQLKWLHSFTYIKYKNQLE